MIHPILHDSTSLPHGNIRRVINTTAPERKVVEAAELEVDKNLEILHPLGKSNTSFVILSMFMKSVIVCGN